MTRKELKVIQDLVQFCKNQGLQSLSADDIAFQFKEENQVPEIQDEIQPDDLLYAASEGVKRKHSKKLETGEMESRN